jgi:peptidoglycan/xylan/chitin deacetylase (PgdA/CDA1 family)
MYRSGLAAAYARLTRASGATVLSYHAVTTAPDAPWIDPANALPAAQFEAQMRFIARSRRAVSMSELVDELQRGNSPPRGTVVVTFDDGYRNTLDVAAPILERHSIPAVVYLPTGCVSRAESPWIDDLYTSFCFRTRQSLDLPAMGLDRVDLARPQNAERAYAHLRAQIIHADPFVRARHLGLVAGQLAPSERVPRLTMTWDEVRQLRDRFPRFEIGAHSIDHVDLCSCGPAEAHRQIEGSFAEATRELSRPPVHFSCPYSRTSPQVRALIREAGYRSSTGGTERVLLKAGADPFELDRLHAPRSVTALAMRTSGAYPALPRLFFGRASA